ncbi:glycoside hydrolase family 127 protein [Salegentibacter sp. F188]|uniref:Glycoside hydrolase family 127 protein n=1 Tax=Autumnicola patrickiae TaxID=3075591 RepID=A0ABU3E3H2_9FLAO|nr:glycoside hydrolase family 127 protein [Salegentibacter sp. F188]MDT0690544.1 glycoside hydrolase family 127 protein [Salegentibacter sp. F188]
MRFKNLLVVKTGVRKFYFLALGFLFIFFTFQVKAQAPQKIKFFELEDVQLNEGAFKNAQDVDLQYIMDLDPDRLLFPFLREAGLTPKAESYPNWENTGLDGHIGGHYLTALSLMYASTGNQEVLDRLNYMLKELKRAQDSYGNGYIGGVPESRELWQEIESGNLNPGSFSLNDRWVPLYNIHKTYAGLRDAYLLADSELAKEMLINYSDWMINITKNLTDEQVQSLLISEHGGLNEVFADVAEITGDKKYLDLAYNFSHQEILDPLKKHKDELNGMHANTQIPKVVGFQAIAALSGDEEYHEAAKYFWENVVNQRTVAIGGNSVREHFHPTTDFSSMINSVQGPETCNTYNMLKLSKQLFQAEGQEKYLDYYEEGLYNHILSSQNPDKGGFVYFTPMRPGHYRVYSQPETSFWCCVGSGIENHAKYNELIYAHSEDDLYVNLFIPSILNWKEKGFSLTQETNFPEEESTSFLVKTENPQDMNLKLRYPQWIAPGEFKVEVNGKPVKVNSEPGSYVSINRKWKDGDRLDVQLPMHLTSERLPDGSDYKALKYGPIVLAAKIGKDSLPGLFADASRGGHIAAGEMIPQTEMPYFLSDKTENIEKLVKQVEGKKLTFSASEVLYPSEFKDLEFIPFYKLHESRYVLYLPLETTEGIQKIKKELKEKEKEEKMLAAITIDMVTPGEQQPEADHFIESENSNIGVHRDRHWRDANGWFSYRLVDKEKQARKLRITFFGGDSDRNFKIIINDKVIAEESFNGLEGNRFYEKDYTLPAGLVKNSNGVLNVKFEALPGSRTAGIYGVRLIK